jgi:hypothetical protein
MQGDFQLTEKKLLSELQYVLEGAMVAIAVALIPVKTFIRRNPNYRFNRSRHFLS